jgi:hypothetical protein
VCICVFASCLCSSWRPFCRRFRLLLSLETYGLSVRARPSAAIELREMELEQNMPKYGAVYTVLWKRGEDGFFRVADEYTLKERRRFSFLNNYVLVATV